MREGDAQANPPATLYCSPNLTDLVRSQSTGKPIDCCNTALCAPATLFLPPRIRSALWWHALHTRSCVVHWPTPWRASFRGGMLCTRGAVWCIDKPHMQSACTCSKMHIPKPRVRDGSGGRTFGAPSSRVPPLLPCCCSTHCVPMLCSTPAEPIATHSPPVPFGVVCLNTDIVAPCPTARLAELRVLPQTIRHGNAHTITLRPCLLIVLNLPYAYNCPCNIA